ncbi:MAG: CDP-alcohol phosphatidyltransferase family protein [Gemmatimonadota bacterium]|nr:MAG: CDP-alcohol phosphatidyltransferase family protein [Gemmatimonadota bacterium]
MRRAIERRLVAALQPIIDWLVRKRVHPNVLSTIGFLVTMSSAFAFHSHHARTAGALILLGGVFDVFDGRVARATGLASKFGAFYDSTLDRISEIAVYLGILSLYNDYRLVLGDVGMIYAVMLAMAGSLMISYTRARAEALGIDCKVGLMQRGERVVAIGLASLLFGESASGLALRVVIIVLAVLTNLTAIQRIIWVYQYTREPKTSSAGSGPDNPQSTGEELAVGTGEEKR